MTTKSVILETFTPEEKMPEVTREVITNIGIVSWTGRGWVYSQLFYAEQAEKVEWWAYCPPPEDFK